MESTSNEALLQESWSSYSKGAPAVALAKVEEALKANPTGKAFWQKAFILRALGRPQDAVNLLKEAISLGLEDYPLHDLLTDLLWSLGFYDEASAENSKAFKILDATTIQNEDFQKRLAAPGSGSIALDLSANRTRMVVRGTQIVNMKMQADLVAKIAGVQAEVDKERLRIVELLGLFAAILAFVFSSVQIVSHIEFPMGYALMIGIGLVLMTFLLGLHFVLEPERRSRPAQGLLVVAIVALLLLPWYARLIASSFPSAAVPNASPAVVKQPSPTPSAPR